MKYLLAIISRLIDIYGEDIIVSCGISCEFQKTLQTSPLLSEKVAATNIKFIVPSFHGHSHNCACQVKQLLLYVKGTGKEDFEGCECFFSLSNNLAAGTQLSTPFHCHQSIAQFVAFWIT